MAFNPSGTVCGVAQTSGTSQYNICNGGVTNQNKCSSSSGAGVALNGQSNFGAGTYYFMNGSNNSTGVAINGGTSGSPSTLGAGTYSLQNGSMSIGSAATVTVASDTTTTYISEPNGAFSNAGKVTFGVGTIYFNDGSGGFTSTGTAAGALTFTGGKNSGGNPSTYYFYNPSGGGNTALKIAANATAAFGPATYYIVNGNLEIDGGAILTCPNCAVGGAGDTFVLTGTGSGNTLTGNIGTVQMPPQPPSAITTTLNAPGTGTYAGLMIFQDRNAAAGSLNNGGNNCSGSCNYLDGGSTMNMTGAIYLPKGVVYFQGGNSSGNCLVLLDLETIFQGNSSLTSDGCTAAGVKTAFTNHVALTQ